jgi:serine/threonine protein kinase
MILFIMIAQHPPFTEAKSTDPFYKCIAGNRADIFWRTHSKNKPGGENFFSKELKELLTCMLQVEPAHRPSMAEILAHPWMKLDTPSIEEIKTAFFQREKEVKAAMDAER